MKSYNVLIVDDSPITQRKLSDILTDAGHKIAGIVSNGLEGSELYLKFKDTIDLITMDITMPVMSGDKALERIMKEDPDAKVIMVTAVGKKDVMEKCLKLGAKNFITKPFDSEKVLKVIETVGVQ